MSSNLNISSSDIAVIGMSGRFPQAAGVEELWRNLCAGREGIRVLSDEEFVRHGEAREVVTSGEYVKAVADVAGIEFFDNGFFGFTPRDATLMDPQLRLLLECAWATVEHAGYNVADYRGAIGVFAGAGPNSYFIENLVRNQELMRAVAGPQSALDVFTTSDALSTMVSFKLNLRGPSISVQTACSTSLVAVHLACQSLLSHECAMVLAGGVNLNIPQERGYVFQPGMILSPDGHCRPFDKDAAGTIFGGGVGLVLLKRLADAVADRDCIYAVIKGSAVNNDGSTKAGFTAPSVVGQAAAVADALAIADVPAETIGYVEAHGTGTALGDPIEVEALTRAFRQGTARNQFCGIGSVKSNIGHLDRAAGVTGLIKAALALHRGQIPATLHYRAANPNINFPATPFYVVDKLTEWKPARQPRRAMVNSLGFGGTNACVILEEAPALAKSGGSRPYQLLTISARTETALDAATANLAEHFEKHADVSLADAAFTLQVGRQAFDYRRSVVGRDAAEIVAKLRGPQVTGKANSPGVVFMFPGQGAQYAGMGAELYRTEPVFRTEVDRCAAILGFDLRAVLFPAAGHEEEARRQLIQTKFTQPALFVIEYALARLWMSWGVQPMAMIGHSVGEYAAACLAGVLTLEDAVALVAERAALVQALPGGAMLAVRLTEAEVTPLLNARLAVAAVNSPKLCVVSGPEADVAELEKRLEAQGTGARRLQTSHAFHSPMMEPVLAPFTERLRRVKFNAPQIPYVSNVTGNWITAAEATRPEYWAGHVRQTVRFADGVAKLLAAGTRLFLEVGPGQGLSQMVRQTGGTQVATSLNAATGDWPTLLEGVGRVWGAGVPVDWRAFYANEERRRVALPTYPFEKKRHWIEAPGVVAAPVQPRELPAVVASGAGQTVETLRGILANLSGKLPAELPATATFVELGFDSLFLAQFSRKLKTELGAAVNFGQLMDQLATLQALADHLDQSRAVAVPAVTPVAKTPAAEVITLPTTPGQREIWLASSLSENASRAYNEVVVLRLRGKLGVESLRAALQELVNRTDALRITISADGQQQCIHPTRTQELRVVDAVTEDFTTTLFDFVNGPLMKAQLVRVSADEHVLHLVFHHVVLDGWSTHVAVVELSRLYTAQVRGVADTEPAALQYRDYVAWYHAPAAVQKRAQDETYWLKAFADKPAAVELPARKGRPPQRSLRAGYARTAIDAEQYRRLKKVSAQAGVTLFHFLLATFSVWARRISGQEDIVVGVPLAGHLAADLQELSAADRMIGHCSNLVPIRSEVRGAESFANHLTTIKRKVAEARTHESFTYGELIEKLNPVRDPSRVPFVSVTFNLNDEPALHWEQLEAEVEVPPFASIFFDFEINMWESATGLRIACYFATDLFDQTMVESWLAQWLRLITSAAENPALPLDRLELLGAADRQRLVVEWNQTAAEYPRDATIHQLFAEQAARTPERRAVQCETSTLTYAELDKQATQLAGRLSAAGVRPGMLVGLFAERSIEMVVGVLGILKSGAAYVPMDPAFPSERLAFMVEDAAMPVIVTQARLVKSLPRHNVRVIVVDDGGTERGELPARVAAESVAYTIFTSGSTGRPKGVPVPHRAVVNFLNSMRKQPGLKPDEVWLSVTTLSFDIAGLELFLPLTTGACVVVATQETAMDGLRLRQELTRCGATVMQATPATWRMLLETEWPGDPRLKILCGGEALPAELAAQLLPVCAELWNMYGPTETTIWSTCCRVTDPRDIHIGRPIDNTQVYIVDAALQPQPVGVAGELLIGGDGLALGYLGRPELTAEKFIANPFRAGERVYRTGDLARWRPDGNVECMGRLDHQVKVRGFRIELGEIETALGQHPAIRDAVVVAREQQLVAYLVASAPPPVSELREFLGKTLPHYMVPALFVFLDRLPLTPNGKVDRKALPAPAAGGRDQQVEFVAPRTPQEIQLAELWRQVLRVPQVGVNDNFFELGGHSLLAVQVTTRLHQALAVELPLRVMFEKPTLGELARHLDNLVWARGTQGRISETELVAGEI
ncbi:MAG: D-alanine--poly(phosphoribitol) ligase subunit 1 [Verrucomicrobiae bacterium]|nr:D-alanine--poly(phosphoribitol) ligase subunit 1 [Verrucomicrobiae bacterium]